VQFFSALPLPGHEISLRENRQMFRDRLPGHFEPLTQLAKPLAIPAVQPVQQLPAARIGQSAKHSIVIHAGDMEPYGCLMIGNPLVACQVIKRAPTRRQCAPGPIRFAAS
jgi:hypothetical protein